MSEPSLEQVPVATDEPHEPVVIGEAAPAENAPPEETPHEDAPETTPKTAEEEDEITHAQFVEWIERSQPRELMMLPFDCVAHITDQYEVALIRLYKKNWDIGKIRRRHFLLYAPLLELPLFSLPEKMKWTTYVVRFFALAVLIAALFGALFGALSLTGYEKLFPLLAVILALTLLGFHYLVARDTFRYWQTAYEHIDKDYLAELLPRKKAMNDKSRSRKKQ